MKMKIIISVLVVVIIAIFAGIGVVVFASDYWENDWDDGDGNGGNDTADMTGSWGIEIVAVYSDGTKKSIKHEVDNPFRFFTMKDYGGMEITNIEYYINAKAHGEGYSSTQIDYSDFTLDWKLTQGRDEIVANTYTKTFETSSPAPLAVDNEWHKILTFSTLADDIAPSTVDTGEYTLHATPRGSLYYLEGSEWKDGGLPVSIFLSVSISQDYIIVEFEAGYRYS